MVRDGARRSVTYGVGFGMAGAVVAMALLAYDYFFLISPAGTNTASNFDQVLFLAACPPSFALMAMERAKGTSLAFGLLFIVLTNAGLYGTVGSLIGRTIEVFRQSN